MANTLLAFVLAATAVTGVVFDDANGNGRRDPGEAGLAGVAVSDGVEVVVTAADGTYSLPATGRNVFVVTPGDRRRAHPGGGRPRRRSTSPSPEAPSGRPGGSLTCPTRTSTHKTWI